MKSAFSQTPEALLRQAACIRGVSIKDLAQTAQISRTRLYHRLSHPDSFNISEIRDVTDALALNADDCLQLVSAMLWPEEG